MAKFTCTNKECSLFNIEQTEHTTTRKVNKETGKIEIKEAVCPECKQVRTETTEFNGLCANLATFSMMTKEQKTEHLKKRSAEHSKRTILKHKVDIDREKGFAV